MKICVVGAGAVGGHLAARLHSSGSETSVLARGAALEAIAKNGILLRTPAGEIRAAVRAVAHAADLGLQDAVVFTVKEPDLPVAVENARALFSRDTCALFVVNGIPWWYTENGAGAPSSSAAERIASVIAPRQSVGSVLYTLCSVPEPGVVEVRNPVSRLVIGDVPAGDASPATMRLADAFRSDAMKVEISSDIRNQVWEKLILLLSTIPLSVLAQASPLQLFKEPACEDISRALIREVTSLAKKRGRHVNVDPDAMIAASRSSAHRPSILQDLDAGRRMEVDALFTAPLEIAKRVGVRMPTLAMLTALVKARARAAGLY
jgi:2-dehydropantoate 2-reductase